MRALLWSVLLGCWIAAPAAGAATTVERGAYLFAAAGCSGCHTDEKAGGPLLAGGPPLKTPFGIFYGPNITADPEFGIGRWSDADFRQALRQGKAPDGSNYFPVFPYPAFTELTDEDILALKAYIFSLPPVAKPSKPHDIDFPFGWRFLQFFWRQLYFTPGPFQPDPARDAQWNRGAYLVQGITHCGECHTPRGSLGGLDATRALAGTRTGPGGGKVPNITPDKDTGIGTWSPSDVASLLKTGLLPDGDVVGSLMGEVVQRSTSKLSSDDRKAIATYILSLPPISNPEAKAVKAE